MNVNRRAFLKGAAAVASAAAVPAAAHAADGRSREAPVWHRAPCRFCGAGCSLQVAVRNGRAVALKGDLESPVNRGMACVKGYHALQTLYGRDRIVRPLIRRNGTLTESTLAEAYDEIAARMRTTVARHGPDSVAIYGSGHWSVTDAYIATKLGKGAIGTANIDTSARLHHAAARAGLVSTFGLDGGPGCFEDLDHADVFVLWGHNMAESDPVLFSRILERRRVDPGVRIIDVGTRTTRTTYAADRALIHAPHMEIALANAICHELVVRRAVSLDFVRRYVAFARGTSAPGYGTEELVTRPDDVSAVSWETYVRFLESYAPARAARAVGVAEHEIQWLASIYADRSRNVLSIWGAELNQHARGTWVNNAIHNIHLLVGRVATPGNGTYCSAVQPSGADAVLDAGARPDALPRGSLLSADDRAFAARVWGVPADRIPRSAGRSALAMFRGLESGAVRFLWVQASNPLAGLPDVQRYRRAVGRDGSFLVVTDAYPTATTAQADVVLPAALWLEKDGVYGSADRNAQHFARMVQPPGDARADGWHMIEVARRLGHAALFPWPETDYVEDAWRELARFNAHPVNRQPALEHVRSRAGVRWPFVAGADTRWRYNTAHDPAADRTQGSFDFYGYSDHRARIWLRPHEPPAEAPDRSYPYWLITGSMLEHAGTGTLTRRIPALRRAAPRAFAELNREDAAELGVRSGNRVRLTTRRGSLEIEARVAYRAELPRGMVVVAPFDDSAPVNLLTLDACCPLSGQPDRKCAVRVERIG